MDLRREVRDPEREGVVALPPLEGPRDPVGEFPWLAGMRRAWRAPVVCSRFRLGNPCAGHPTRRGALWRMIHAAPRISIPPSRTAGVT